MITVFLSLCIVIVFMHFAHELEEKLSTVYNYTAIQTELGEAKLFGIKKNTHSQLVAQFETIPVYYKNTTLKQHNWETLSFHSRFEFHCPLAKFAPQTTLIREKCELENGLFWRKRHL